MLAPDTLWAQNRANSQFTKRAYGIIGVVPGQMLHVAARDYAHCFLINRHNTPDGKARRRMFPTQPHCRALARRPGTDRHACAHKE